MADGLLSPKCFILLLPFFICSYIYVSIVNSTLTVGLYYWWKILKNLLFFMMKLPISLVWWDIYIFFLDLLLLNYCLRLYAVCSFKSFWECCYIWGGGRRIQRFPSILLIINRVSAYSEITWAVRLAAVMYLQLVFISSNNIIQYNCFHPLLCLL